MPEEMKKTFNTLNELLLGWMNNPILVEGRRKKIRGCFQRLRSSGYPPFQLPKGGSLEESTRAWLKILASEEEEVDQ